MDEQRGKGEGKKTKLASVLKCESQNNHPRVVPQGRGNKNGAERCNVPLSHDYQTW